MSGDIFADLTVDTLTPSAPVRDEMQSGQEARLQKIRQRQAAGGEEATEAVDAPAPEHKIDRMA